MCVAWVAMVCVRWLTEVVEWKLIRRAVGVVARGVDPGLELPWVALLQAPAGLAARCAHFAPGQVPVVAGVVGLVCRHQRNCTQWEGRRQTCSLRGVRRAIDASSL